MGTAESNISKEQKKNQEWKDLADDLKTLIHLESSDIKNEFENQKKHLNNWLESLSDRLKVAENISEKKLQEAISSIEELRVQLALGKAETEDALNVQQKKISLGIQKVKMGITNIYDSSTSKIDDIVEETDDKLTDFHTRFDMFKLQFHLGKEEAKEAFILKKKDISEKLNSITEIIENGIGDGIEARDIFYKSMSESWKNLKKNLSDL